MKKNLLTIVIPAFNEKENFSRGVLAKVSSYLHKVSYRYEVLIIDDGSTDGTEKLLREFCDKNSGFYYFSRPHLGKASAIAYGVDKAKGELLLFADFDQATPLSEIEKLLPFIDKGYDVVIGSREVKGAKREKEPFYRHLMGRVFNLVVKIIAFGGIADTQCGFKLFKAEVAKKLFAGLYVYAVDQPKKLKHAFTGAVDVELLFLANKLGYKVAEVPVHWRHYQTTRVNPWRDSLRMFVDVVKIRFYELIGKYAKK